MPIKSDNTQGNPYHDESTGEFTSANGGSAKQEQVSGEMSGQPKVDPATNVSNVENVASPVRKFKFKIKGNIEDLRQSLENSNKVASIPFLSSARDIVEHFEEFLTPEIVSKIDSYFGKFSVPYKYFNLRTDPDQRCGVNIFAACIGKKRWANNYLKLIDYKEYTKLLYSYGYQALYRGLNCRTYEEYKTIADSYSSKENEMIYGSRGGTCYGIAVYTSTSRMQSRDGYAGGNDSHVMELILDKRNTRTMSYRSICNIRDNISYYKDQLTNKAEQVFINNGIEPSRASRMARSLGITLGDEGFIAMLCGVEWYDNGSSYYMVENLGAMYRFLR